jgi:hypothetical protein
MRSSNTQGFNSAINVFLDRIDGETRRDLARRVVFERLQESGRFQIQPTHQIGDS